MTDPDAGRRDPGQDDDAETVHRCPAWNSARTPCCGRTPFELPTTDRLTVDDHLVTCTGTPAAG